MSREIRVTRRARLPDRVRLERYARLPELGPKILFLSGGTALRPISKVLKSYTHNSIHLITPFDSGGSSAVLRDAFAMLAVGDLRNRLMALADESVKGNPEIYQLFSHRLHGSDEPTALRTQLAEMIEGSHPLVAAVRDPMKQLVRTHLRMFGEAMPDDFDLRNASIGNLILVGGYLANERDIDSVIFMFSKLVEVRGVVRPTIDCDLHLAAELADGSTLVGQHVITNSDRPATRIDDLRLVVSKDNPTPASVTITDYPRKLLTTADLICYPIGSFYSSVIANLLPKGVGRAIVGARCPKIYIPNMGTDSEHTGMTVTDAVATIIEHTRRDAGADTDVSDILNFVLWDSTRSDAYATPLDPATIEALGVRVIDAPVGTRTNATLDPLRTTEVLLSLT